MPTHALRQTFLVVLLPAVLAACQPAQPAVSDMGAPALQAVATDSVAARSEAAGAATPGSGAAASVGGSDAITGTEASAGGAVTAGTLPAGAADASGATRAAGEAPMSPGARVFVIVPTASEAMYTAEEEFLQGAVDRLGVALGLGTALGTTNQVSGQIVALTGETVAIEGGDIAVDVSTLASDDDRRDSRLREQWLESAAFPAATFRITGTEGLPAEYVDGREISFRLHGDMTAHGVTTPVSWDVTARIEGDVLTGTAETTVSTRDFGFDPPELAGLLKVNDGIKLAGRLRAEAR